MKNLLLFSILAGSAFGASNDLVQQQRDPTNMSTLPRLVTIPSGSADGVLTFDGSAVLPKIWTFGNGIVRSSGQLIIDFTGKSLSDINLSVPYSQVSGTPTLGTAAAQNSSAFATSTQGSKADSALQSSDIGSSVQAYSSNLGAFGTNGSAFYLSRSNHTGTQAVGTITGLATVATSGSYSDLSGLPTLGTASAQNTGAFATSAQGSTADSALQPAGNGSALSGLTQSQISGLVSALSGKFPNPAGSTGQYIRGDGTLATFPSTGTVTSVGIASSDFSVTGSPVTTSGNITVNLAVTGISAGTYSSLTVNTKGVASAGTNRSFSNSPSRSLVTTAAAANGFQVSASRDSHVSYNIGLSSTATIGGASTATVVLEICATNSTTAGDWITIGEASNGQTITLAVILQSIQAITIPVIGYVPAGYYCRIRQALTGTSSATIKSGQEVIQ